jgi:hypothetical protein
MQVETRQSEAQYESEETMDEHNASETAMVATERLQAATERLEKTVAWLEERQAAMTGDVARIVATVDATADARQREQDTAGGNDAVAGEAGYWQRRRPGGRLAGCCTDRFEPGAARVGEGATDPQRSTGLDAAQLVFHGACRLRSYAAAALFLFCNSDCSFASERKNP